MPTTGDWRVAFTKATTWGTAVAVGALDGVDLVSETLPTAIPNVVDDNPLGTIIPTSAYHTGVEASGDTVEFGRYEGLDLWLAFMMGQDTVSQPDVPQSPSSYQHDMVWQTSVDGIFGTWAIDKNVDYWEYPGAKLNQLTLAVTDGIVQATCNWILSHCVKPASTNTATQHNAVTFQTRVRPVRFQDLVFMIEKRGGTQLDVDADQQLEITDFTLTFNRNLEGDPVNKSSGQINEPDINGPAEITLSITVPTYSATRGTTSNADIIDDMIDDALVTLAGGQTEYYKVMMEFTGSQTNSADTVPLNEYIHIWLPKLKISTAEAPGSGAGNKVPITFEMKAYQDNAPDSEFTGGLIDLTGTPAGVICLNGITATRL